MHFERGRRIHRVPAGRAEEVANHCDIRVEDLRGRGGGAIDRQRSRRAAGARGAGRHLDGWLLLRSVRCRRRRGTLGAEAGLERAESFTVLLLDGFELLPQLFNLLPQRLDVWRLG